MTGFDIADRYDIAMAMVMGALTGVALNLGAPLWVPVVIVFVMCVIGFVRHYHDIMDDPVDSGSAEPKATAGRAERQQDGWSQGGLISYFGGRYLTDAPSENETDEGA
jgi:hypothetical protein